MESYEPINQIEKIFHRANSDNRVVTKNERLLLSAIWRGPGTARSLLQKKLDLTQQSIHRIISALESRDILMLGEKELPNQKGKPTPKLYLNPNFAYSVGISVNTDSAGVAVMDFNGSVNSTTVDIKNLSILDALARISERVQALLDSSGFSWDRVLGIGFAISGYLVEETRYNTPDPLVEWSYLQLGPYLSDYFNKPVWVENSANTSTLSELMLGVGQEVDNFVYLSFNYGFGAGIVMERHLQKGGFGNAGEISGIFTPEENADRPRLKTLLELLQKHQVEVESIAGILENYDDSWPGLTEWLDRVEKHNSRVVNVLSSVIDPQMIVYGGQLPPKLAQRLIERTKFYGITRHGISRQLPALVVSKIEGDTASIGAAMLPLKAVVF